jgi:hypothetical protein
MQREFDDRNPISNYGIAHPAWISHCAVSDIAMSLSLEDRIRLLTNRAIAAKTQSELDAILPELKATIGDHILPSAGHRG